MSIPRLSEVDSQKYFDLSYSSALRRSGQSEGWKFTIFKERWKDYQAQNLTLPKLYIGRCVFIEVSLHNSDLCRSRLCWNDFTDCDFSEANLTDADLRASIFEGCKFIGSCLANADLRHSTFDMCDFMKAEMQGVKLTPKQASRMALTRRQYDAIEWQENEGPEPEGG